MISGKSFSDECDWVIDPRYPKRRQFQYLMARSGDRVFLNGDYVKNFPMFVPFAHTKSFVFVVHNTDNSFGAEELSVLLPHAIHVYAINTVIEHPKLTTIPLGFVDNQLQFLANFKPPVYERTIEIYMNFKECNNRVKRKECIEAFENDSRVVRKDNIPIPEYYDDLCRSKFVLCPEGMGMDTHRVYEALLCGATPVVLRNTLCGLYSKLPVCILDSWSDDLYVPLTKEPLLSIYNHI